MNFTPSEEQLAVQTLAREFAHNEVLPKAAEIDREHRHPAELVKRMAELGFLGIAVPEQYGGAGFDNVSYALALEQRSFGLLFNTADQREGMSAVLAKPKRKPGFQGK